MGLCVLVSKSLDFSGFWSSTYYLMDTLQRYEWWNISSKECAFSRIGWGMELQPPRAGFEVSVTRVGCSPGSAHCRACGRTVSTQWLESESSPGFPWLGCSVEVLTPISEQRKCSWEVGRAGLCCPDGIHTKCFINGPNKLDPSSNYCEKNTPRICNIILHNFVLKLCMALW